MNNIFGKSSSVSEALDTRLTCRAFLDKEINKDTVFDILNGLFVVVTYSVSPGGKTFHIKSLSLG